LGLHDDANGDDIRKPTSTANTNDLQEITALWQLCKWHFKRHSGTNPERADELHEPSCQCHGDRQPKNFKHLKSQQPQSVAKTEPFNLQ
jgi:hypothetical protein